jgi:hypothetical protein
MRLYEFQQRAIKDALCARDGEVKALRDDLRKLLNRQQETAAKDGG